jgi:hypothetical protein
MLIKISAEKSNAWENAKRVSIIMHFILGRDLDKSVHIFSLIMF